MSERERELFEELAAAFPEGSQLHWRDEGGEIVVRALDEPGIEEALRPSAPREDGPDVAASEPAPPRAPEVQLGLFGDDMDDEGGSDE